MIAYLELDGDKVLSYNSSPISQSCVEVEIENNHPIWFGVGGWHYADGVLFKDEEGFRLEVLQNAKTSKISEIDKKCNEAILKGFCHEINGEKIWFSYDMEAQMNFERLRKDFESGVITEQMWTAKNEAGDYIRVSISKELMTELSITTNKHVDKKVGKFRDYYMSLIMEAQTLEEVNAIQWEYTDEALSREELEAELERHNNTPTVEQLKMENENLTMALLELGDLLLGTFKLNK